MLRKKYKNGKAWACSRRLLVTPNPLINNGFPVGNAILGVPRKQQKNLGNTVGANCVRPLKNAQIHEKSVGFGVPDEPIRQRRITSTRFWDDVGIVPYIMKTKSYGQPLAVVRENTSNSNGTLRTAFPTKNPYISTILRKDTDGGSKPLSCHES